MSKEQKGKRFMKAQGRSNIGLLSLFNKTLKKFKEILTANQDLEIQK